MVEHNRGKKIFDNGEETIYVGVPFDWTSEIEQHRYPFWFLKHLYHPVFGMISFRYYHALLTAWYVHDVAYRPENLYFKWLKAPTSLSNDIDFINSVLEKKPITQLFYRLFNVNNFKMKLSCLLLFNAFIELQSEEQYRPTQLVLDNKINELPLVKQQFEKEQAWVDSWSQYLDLHDEGQWFERLSPEEQADFIRRKEIEEELERFFHGATVHERIHQLLAEEKNIHGESTDVLVRRMLNFCLGVLELPLTTNPKDPEDFKTIKKAHRVARFQVHPDRNGWNASEAQFSLINIAYKQLVSWRDHDIFQQSLTDELNQRWNERWRDFKKNFNKKHTRRANLILNEIKKLKAKSDPSKENLLNQIELQEKLIGCYKSSIDNLEYCKSILEDGNTYNHTVMQELKSLASNEEESEDIRRDSLFRYDFLKGLYSQNPKFNLIRLIGAEINDQNLTLSHAEASLSHLKDKREEIFRNDNGTTISCSPK